MAKLPSKSIVRNLSQLLRTNNPRRLMQELDAVNTIANTLQEKRIRGSAMRTAQQISQRKLPTRLTSDMVNDIIRNEIIGKPKSPQQKAFARLINPKNVQNKAVNIAVKRKEISPETALLFASPARRKQMLQNATELGTKRMRNELNLLVADKDGNVTRVRPPRPKLPQKPMRILSGKDKANAMAYDAEDKLIRHNMRQRMKDHYQYDVAVKRRFDDNSTVPPDGITPDAWAQDMANTRLNDRTDFIMRERKNDLPFNASITLPATKKEKIMRALASNKYTKTPRLKEMKERSAKQHTLDLMYHLFNLKAL
jgi:hypothetical protein